MIRRILIFSLIVGQFLCSAAVSSPEDHDVKIKRIGIPFITSYRTRDYSSSLSTYGSQNFDVQLGDDDKMYFANIEGLLIFDGIDWKRLRLPGRAGVYSLVKTKDGTIYVGGIDEIGYLSTNSNGQLKYNSIKGKLGKDAEQNFTAWKSFLIGDQVVFVCDQRIFIFNHQTNDLKIIECNGAKQNVFIRHGQVFSKQKERLSQLNGSSWKEIPNSSFIDSPVTNNILSVDVDDKQTIVISQNGFIDLDANHKISITEDLEHLLKNCFLISAQMIFDKYILICTSKGILITDTLGKTIQFLDQKKGLTDNMTFNAALDGSGLLWIGTNSGIDAVEILSPFSLFDERSGINGNVSFAGKHQDDIYLASASGTYRQKWKELFNPLDYPTFDKLNAAESRFLIHLDQELLSLGINGTLVLKKSASNIIEGSGQDTYWTGMRYKDSNDVLLGSSNGKILHLTKEQEKWKVRKEMDASFSNALFMAEGSGMNIWVCQRNGVFKLEYDLENARILSEKKYGQPDGLPYGVDNYVFSIDSKPCFTTLKGIYKYNSEEDNFIKDQRFESTVGDLPLLRMTQDKMGNIYCLSDGYLVLKKKKDGYEMLRILNEKLFNYNPFNIVAFDSTNIILPTFNAFVHVDPTIPLNYSPFETKISSARSIESTDSIYYAGFGNTPDIQLAKSDKAIRFSFSAAYYQNIEQTKYKWRLIGSDDKWSSWSDETTKDYTNLPHGEYTFEVVARNVLFVEGTPAIIHFTVPTPWYFTFWAYAIYVILFFAFIWMLVVWNSRRLVAKNKRLEKIIDDRTAQITEQRNKLLQMDDLKKRFFVNISHELRTPLTLSMGTVDQAIKGVYGQLNDDLYANLKVSKRNSERLLKMVNSILDISKLEGGRIQLYAEPVDPAKILEKVLAFFSSRLADKHIKLKETFSRGLELYLDRDKFETILINLISNAFKFTEDGGTISVEMIERDHEIAVIVKDTGEGIPEKDLSIVFDRFYQSPSVKSGEGIGVGLALTKELVELHHGLIEAKNENGAAFTMTFPKGKDHLSPNQIAEHDESRSVTSMQDKYPLHDDIASLKQSTIQGQELNIHILLVEDNPEMRQFIASILSPHYRISAVGDGTEALEFLSREVPDLIITDYLMPKMDGYEMAIEIKKSDEWAFIPMVFLTARAREQDKLNVLNLGVDDYMFKPFSSEELLVRIKNLLNTKKQRTNFVKEESIDPRDIDWKEFPSKLKLDIDGFIKHNIKAEISIESLCDLTGQSERSLYRKVKVNTGLSLKQYIKEYRLRTARTMLENREVQTVSAVAYAVGFNYLSHFTKNYKERFGKQPSEYLE
ncbi:MAG: response regulator [Cyclobacteriaceae bacterium]